MHFQITVFLTFVAVAIGGTSCAGTKDHIQVPDNVTNSANLLFVNTDNYTTSVSNATEEEMNALEFTSSYASGDSGNTWLVSEELQPVIQTSKIEVQSTLVWTRIQLLAAKRYLPSV